MYRYLACFFVMIYHVISFIHVWYGYQCNIHNDWVQSNYVPQALTPNNQEVELHYAIISILNH